MSLNKFSLLPEIEISNVIKETIESWICQYIINEILAATVIAHSLKSFQHSLGPEVLNRAVPGSKFKVETIDTSLN